ncbi:hypothetical protein MUK42_15958, partial [Musa troglodytarum]
PTLIAFQFHFLPSLPNVSFIPPLSLPQHTHPPPRPLVSERSSTSPTNLALFPSTATDRRAPRFSLGVHTSNLYKNLM